MKLREILLTALAALLLLGLTLAVPAGDVLYTDDGNPGAAGTVETEETEDADGAEEDDYDFL